MTVRETLASAFAFLFDLEEQMNPMYDKLADATEEEMKEALKKSCAEFVMQLPDGIDTICTEKGGGLSEGQAQRIAIARALLRNRPIMIFDESTSALDPETERQLLANILSKKDKTIIFVTHRPAVVEYCDHTLKINKQ